MSEPEESLSENPPPRSGASSVQSVNSGETSGDGLVNKSTKPMRGPPPPIPAKPPRVHALSKGCRSHSSAGSGKSASGNSDDSSEGSCSKNSAAPVHIKVEDNNIYENIRFPSTSGAHVIMAASPMPSTSKMQAEGDTVNKSDQLQEAEVKSAPEEEDEANGVHQYKIKNVEIFISDVDNPEVAEDIGADGDNSLVNSMIPLINELLPRRLGSKSPNNNKNGTAADEGNDETCITGCSWELEDDDDGTDCSSSSSGLDRDRGNNVKPPTIAPSITTPKTLRKATVGCGMAAASSTNSSTCVDTQLKDQIVVVKLAAKVVQCPSVSPSSPSPRPPPPPPPVPSYPDSSTATDSSSASNPPGAHDKNNGNACKNSSMLNDQEDDPGKDGNEPGLEESSTSELYQNMVVAHGLMIERETGDRDVMTVQKVVDRQQRTGNLSRSSNGNKNQFMISTARPLTEGKGVDDLSDDDEGEAGDDQHCYQNVIVKKGKFSVATKKSNTRSSRDPSVQSVPLMEATSSARHSGGSSSTEKGYSTRILELDSLSSEAPVPVVHAVINLPPRKVSMIKERRRNRLENLSYQKASRINERMVADFKTAGNDRPSSLSVIRDGKVMSVTSNNCSDLQNSDGTAVEPGSIIGKVKIGFGLNKAKSSLRKSKSLVSNQVERARRKVGSWYQRRVRTPVEHFGAEFGKSRSSQLDISSSFEGSESGGSGWAREQKRRSRSHESRSLSAQGDFEELEKPLDDEDGPSSGPAYSNVVYDRRRSQSIDLPSPTTTEDIVEANEESEDESSFKTKGQNEFEELRRVVKQGGDFCKDLAAVLHERSELEAQYAKGLSKLSAKLLKASKEATGSVAHAWQAVAVQIDTQAELHRQWSTALSEEVARPLRNSLETQHKIRKSVEVLVEKTTRNLAEWRTAESKAKRQCFSSSKEFEKLQESSAVIVNNNLNAANSSGSNNGNTGSNTTSSASNLGGSNLALAEVRTRSRLLSVPPMEKDPIKLEAKRRKAEEAVRRADIEYYTFCVRSERARLEWESAIRNGSTCLRTLEEEKLSLLRDLAVKYYQFLNELAPRQVQSVESLEEPVKNCSISQDMHAIVDIRRHAGAEQLLPDFYAEDTSNLMKRERRQEALQKFLHLVHQDLEREKKGAVGIESLAKAIAEAPTIDNAHHDISDKLYYVKSMLLYLEGTRCKVDNALADIEGRSRTSNPVTQYMRHQRDKQGFPQTILKVPSWAKDECLSFFTGGSSAGSNSPDWNDRGNADGTSGQHETDFDEFSSQDSGCDHNTDSCGEESNKAPSNIISAPSIGKCKAIYDYDANLFDELTIRIGDVINIHDKQEDGWWLGELNGIIGIFPATYVEEISTADANSADC